jgi:hypothetical protein
MPCDAGCTRVRQITHCATEGTMFTMPQYGLNMSVGRIATYSAPNITDADLNSCEAYTGNANVCQAAQADAEAGQNVAYTGIVTMNNVNAATYDCGGSQYDWNGPPPGGATNLFGPWNGIVTTSARDAVCCMSQ